MLSSAVMVSMLLFCVLSEVSSFCFTDSCSWSFPFGFGHGTLLCCLGVYSREPAEPLA